MSNSEQPQMEMDDARIDEFGRYFLCVVMEKLDEVLKSRGIDGNERRIVCQLFTDNLATFLDAGWLANQTEKLWPVLTFACRASDVPGAIGGILKLFVPSRESFHSEGGAEGAIAKHFDADDDANEWLSFRAGLRGEDGMPTG